MQAFTSPLRPTILVVEDSPTNLLLMSELLSDHYRVKVATGGEQALKIAQTRPDLIVLDIMMADMDGYDVCSKLKQDPQTADIPIIFLTAKGAPHDEEKGLLLGAADYITKPIRPVVFMARIQTQLQLRQYALQLGDIVKQRTAALEQANHKLEQLVATGIELGYERDHHVLLRKILLAGQDLLHCDAGMFLLKTEQDTLQMAMHTRADAVLGPEMPLRDPHTRQPHLQYASVYCVHQRQSVRIDDVPSEQRFDMAALRALDLRAGYRTVSMLVVPLASRGGKILGVMQFLNALDPVSGAIIAFGEEQVRFVEALATQAAMLLDNYQLGESQRHLMDAFIELLAAAIDAKSEHTGGHCARVPELAVALAKAACEVNTGGLADFRFHNEDEWREFRIGAWLHDCGKITTPEFVVDKSTKLQTIYNRIHEIRTRFEVLRRDADIARLQALLAGTDAQAAQAQFEAQCRTLEEEFALLAHANVGSENMSDAQALRIQRIGQRRWLRHFDDRLGLAHEELARYSSSAPTALPAEETLLANKPHHIVARGKEAALDPQFHFKVEVPQHLYNFGEEYNLSVRRGTLTEEERFKIKDHIIQTIVMLQHLPLPENLRRVPEYAGTHHETLLGTGYPCGLDATQLSVPARIMAIADIFEALTASDRPYKTGKPLSEAIHILASFKNRKHIDPELFDLFLRSGVYLEFAHRFLQPEQIDTVDIARYLSPAA